MKVLVIGASGMIGSTVLRVLSEKKEWQVFGSVRDESVKRFFPAAIGERLIAEIDVEHPDSLIKLLDQISPNVVVNCAGLTKHKPEAEDPLVSIPINTLMPHRLAGLVSAAENAQRLADSIVCLYKMTDAERAQMGENGRRYFKEHFDPDILTDQLIDHFHAVSGSSKGQ